MNIEEKVTSVNSNNIIYAGFADDVQAEYAKKSRTWVEYPATEEGLQQLVKDGYTAVSCFEFSHAIQEELNEPFRFGDMVLDFDSKTEDGKGDIDTSLQCLRVFLERIIDKYAVDQNSLLYYASGGKGFHVIIPREVIGSQNGDPKLHEIYKGMINEICDLKHSEVKNSKYSQLLLKNRFNNPQENIFRIDFNFFKGGKGQLLRLPNIQRGDGNYKVPVSYKEIIECDSNYFRSIVKNKRNISTLERNAPCVCKSLENIYNKIVETKSIYCCSIPDSFKLASLDNCSFIKFCQENHADVTEMQWFLLANILSSLKFGKLMFHKISALDKQRYNEKETNNKFIQASKYSKITCKRINEYYQCGRDCGVDCPANLLSKYYSNGMRKSIFTVKEDGLYCDIEGKDNTISRKICSYIKDTGHFSDGESTKWSKRVEIKDPLGNIHECLIPFTTLNGANDDAIAELSEHGLIIESSRNAKSLLTAYLKADNTNVFGTIVYKNGWVKTPEFACYMPFSLGKNPALACLYRKPLQPVYRERGTLDSWKEMIGVYCNHNPILQIAILTALAGPVLQLCDHAGFGVHLYGDSSCGKTTALEVACSVTGGELLSWRATSNGLESVAESHNDGCMVIDEVGQVDADSYYDTLYMLPNGKGKTRADKRGGNRRTPSWLLTFLSSGEMTTQDKISQGNSNKVMMAGQDVRCIGIHADGGSGHRIFTTVPPEMTDREFADYLKKETKLHQGTAFKSLIAAIIEEHATAKEFIDIVAKEFISSVDMSELSSQGQRVVNHFALLSAVGEYAISVGILPWKKGDACIAVKFCLKQWQETHGGKYGFEIQEAMDKLLADRKKDFCYYSNEIHERYEKGQNYYFLPRKFVEDKYCKYYQYNDLVQALKSEELLILTSNGKVKEQVSIGNEKDRPRGICVLKQTSSGSLEYYR